MIPENSSTTYSLREALVHLWANLPGNLFSNEQQVLLQKSASQFPPLLRIGIECRMDAREQADLQLCIRRDEDDLQTICNSVAASFSAIAGEQSGLIHFLTEWSDPVSAIHAAISEVFLELDILPSGDRLPLLFFAVEKMNAADVKQLAAYAVEKALGEQKKFLDRFNVLAEELPETARVAYLGILFSRDIEVLRVNIKGLSLTEVKPFLQSVGYAWYDEHTAAIVHMAYNYADRVTLCIDIGETIYPRIGLECFWNQQPAHETYWRHFLYLCEMQGYCLPDKSAAILAWDEEFAPQAGMPWPEHLWLESLRRKENEFAVLKKKISHLKLSCSPGRQAELKAYLGYGNIWRTIGTDAAAVQQSQNTRTVAEAMDHAIDFLLNSQQQSGWWKDFSLPAGASDEWITGFVGWHLAGTGHAAVKPALKAAGEILVTRYREGKGWGYNAVTPADADSTVWAHLFLETAERTEDHHSPPFPDVYAGADGGVATYHERQPIQSYTQLKDSDSMAGWQQAHACVTAAFALAGRTGSLAWLADHQQENGCWEGYWWFSPTYATAIATEAMCLYDAEKYARNISRAKQWAADFLLQQLNELPAFATAMALRTLIAGGAAGKWQTLAVHAVKRLLQLQEQSGAWPASAELRVPMPGITEPMNAGNSWRILDEQKNFTTAAALYALSEAKKLQGMTNDTLDPDFDIDVYDPDFLRSPYDMYTQLQNEHPVFYSERYKLWFVSRYQDVKSLLVSEAWGMPSKEGSAPVCPHWTQTRNSASQAADYFQLRNKALEMQNLWLSLRPDNEDYLRLKNLYASPFTPSKLAMFEERLQRIANEIFEPLANRSRIDIVADIAIPFTIRTIMAVFGIDDAERHEELKRYSTDLLGLLGLNPGAMKREKGLMAMISLLNYFADLGPGETGTFYASLKEQVKSGGMSEDELLSNMVLMVLAGQETSMHLISMIFYCFMRFPEELQKIRNGDTAVNAFVEEVLRYESPSPYIIKFVKEDVTVGAVKIPAKSKVVLLIGAANRDTWRFEDADRFIPTRAANQHVAFGFGRHYCLGAALSRVEGKLIINEFLTRFPDFTIDPEQPLQWINDFRTRGLQHLWVDTKIDTGI